MSSPLVLDQNLVLAAGAGTGKTYSLVTVALGLYSGAGGRPPLEPSRVVAVTFTEKAAAELRGRIVDRTRRLAEAGGDLAGEPELRAALGDRVPSAARWAELLRLVPLAPIGTFHGLCGQLLRQHAPEARLDPRFTILDEGEAGELLERCLEEALLEELADGAGPGRRLVRELGGLDALRSALLFLHAKLAEEGRDAGTLVEGPAFDPAVARESLAGGCAALARALEGLAATDHPRLAGARELLRRERQRLGSCEPERLGDWYPAAAAIATVSRGPGSLPRICKEPWDLFKRAWERTGGAAAAVQQAAVGRDLVGLLETLTGSYTAQKRRRGALDFADLVRRARDLLRDHLEVRREAKARVGALLVDEFQDTNQLQLELTHLLGEARDEERVPGAGGVAALPLAPAILCAVGDRKQSVYEFRGADVSIFSELTARARAGDGFRLVPLTRSFRSRPELVELTNGTFRSLLGGGGRSYEVAWVEEEDRLHAVRAPATPGTAPLIELLGGDPTLAAALRRPFEAGLVADRIAALLAEGQPIEERDGTSHPLRGRDVALLLRAFTNLRPYRDALAARGIPSVVVRGRGFHRAREVRDLSALLLALCDPSDLFASAAVLRSPAAGLSDDALVLLFAAGRLALGSFAGGCGDADRRALRLSPGDAARLDRLGPLVAQLSAELDRLGPGAVLSLAVSGLGILPALAATLDGEQRVANVRKLLASLEGLGGSGALPRALALLAAGDDPKDREPPADVAAAADERAVRILTVHGAKGLEWPVVVLPELGAGEPVEKDAVLFERRLGLAVKPQDPQGSRVADPHAQAVLDELKARREAESARLLYVAVTRARDRLILCGERGPKAGGRSWRALLDGALPAGAVAMVPPPPAEVSAAEVSAAEVSAAEVSAAGVSAAEVSAAELSAAEVSAAEVSAAEVSAAEVSAAELSAAGVSAAGVSPSPPPAPTSPELLTLLALAHPPRLQPGRFASGVSALADLVRCERRFFYRSIAGLDEFDHAPAAPGSAFAPPDDEEQDLPGEQPAPDPGTSAPLAALDPRAAGTLAHLLLERVELAGAAAPGAALAALARQEGYPSDEPAFAAVISAAASLLLSPFGQELRAVAATPGGDRRIHRELPFALALRGGGGAALTLSGQLDLLFVDGEGRATVLDYKLARAGGLERHAFQLRTYALAVRRLLPPEVPLRIGIAWLRDGTVELADVRAAELAAHEALLCALADRLAAIRQRGTHEKLPSRAGCGGCGYAGRCWGEPAAARQAGDLAGPGATS